MVWFETLVRGKIQSEKGVDKLSPQRKKEITAAWAKVGVNLEPDKWIPNPAYRLFTKLIINSLWGKFCQKVNKLPTTKVVKSWDEIKRILELIFIHLF